jgi:hypothetical protein
MQHDPTEYLALSAAAEVDPGWPICAFWVAAWCERVCGVNPGRSIIGRYKTAQGYLWALASEGGLLNLATRLMALEGFPELQQGEPGAVGLIDTAEAGPTLGIMASTGRWVCKGTPSGLVFPEGDVLKMWSPECRL